MKSQIAAFSLVFVLSVTVSESSAQTIEVSLKGRSPVQGKPVYWDKGFVALKSRDGQIVTFRPNEAKGFRQVSKYFSSYSQSEVRGQLMREFGRGFDVSGTGQYLVVHPAGQRDRWAERFEQLYRSMVHYFGARGFELNRPEFPFIAVVFPSQSGYEQYMRKQGVNLGFSTLGYYDPSTNRIHLYDVTAATKDPSQWYVNAETIIHEAAHQTAYNIGIHRRYGYAPLWVVEGIGTMFEARGVWNAQHFPNRQDRINRFQLKQYRRRVNGSNSLDILNQQLAGDRLFDRNSTLAYAHSWAMSFYLSEQQPRSYVDYVDLLNGRGEFREYSAKQRIKDFVQVFGSDLRMFDARLQRFIQSL